MRKILGLAATLMFSATAASAQVTTTLNMTSTHVYTNNGGGGWNASSSVALGNDALTNLVVYCFDNKRFFRFNTPTQYIALTFSQFLGNVGAGPGGRGNNWNGLDLQDLNSIASLIGTYAPNDASAGTRATNGATQQDIWNIGNNGNGTYGGPTTTYADNYMIFVDKAEWERGLDGQNGFQGSQSFMARVNTTVPEPSTYALMGVGLVALGVAARRRQAK